MQLNSFVFLFFLAASVLLYYIIPIRARNYLLIILNYLFYSYFDYRLAILLFILTTSNFIIGNAVRSSKDKRQTILVFTGVGINIIVLGFFKYYNFFIESVNDLSLIFSLNLNLSTLNILLPLGISFYVFQTLTYIFDQYYETLTEKYSFTEFAVFASFFPTIIAGPIERAFRLLPQIKKPHYFLFENISKGFALITVGLFRKMFIGDACGSIVDHVFAEPSNYLSIEILIGIFLYAFQLYNDFAGYSAMARGIAKLFGFNIISNFKQPFFATSITDFWRKWHISLALWLRDYLFKPLQYSFRSFGIYGNIIAIMITFVLCGLWHGPLWTYIFWGALQGFYMSFSLLTINFRESIIKFLKLPNFIVYSFKILITFLLTVFSFFFARAEDFSTAFHMMSIIGNWTASELSLSFIYILVAAIIATLTFDLLELKYKSQAFILRLSKPVSIGISLAFWILIVIYLVSSEKLPFIYAQF